MADIFSATDALVKSADKAGENTAKSAMDTAFQDFKLPTDPNELGKLYGKKTADLSSSLDLQGALDASRSAGNSAADAAGNIFENRIKSEELSKTPVADLDAEIGRLSQMKWGILPLVLGRSDIIDYGDKIKLAQQASGIVDDEITRLMSTRKALQDAADGRAKDRVDALKSQAEILDKKAKAAKDDLDARISLFKEGRGTIDDIMNASLELKKANDAWEKASKSGAGSGDGNPFRGLPGDGGYTPGEIAAFQYFEAFGDWPVTDSSKLQLKQQLTQRYSAWVASGKPGLTKAPPQRTPLLQDPSVQTEGNYYGAFNAPKEQPQETPNAFAPVAENQKKNAAAALMQFLMGAQK